MRFSVLLLLLLSFAARAQNNIADAYLVRAGGDTIRGRILLPRDFDFGNDQSFTDIVWITGDSSQVVYGLKDVNAFGVRKRRMEAHYRKLKLPHESDAYFAKVLQTGPRYTLYYGSRLGAGIVNSVRGPAFEMKDIDMLVLQNSRGDLLPVRRDAWNSGRANLKKFLKDDPDAAQLMKELVSGFLDLYEFVKVINMQ